MTDILKTQKKILRKKTLKKRDSLPSNERYQKSTEIVSGFLKLAENIKFKSVFTYVSFRSEVGTHRMIISLLEQGKLVSVPFTDLNKKSIIPSMIKSFKDDLVPGGLGILEPDPEKIIPVPVDEIDIIVIPGAVFSEKGCRIGYGGGFYDRFLKKNSLKSYALAFEFQIVDEVPFDPELDMKVDYIVTDKRVVKCH